MGVDCSQRWWMGVVGRVSANLEGWMGRAMVAGCVPTCVRRPRLVGSPEKEWTAELVN